jgi:serine/threonine-protein kinase
LPDFFIARYPATVREYLEFLNGLAAEDRSAAAKHAPREAEGAGYFWEPDVNGRFSLPAAGQRQLQGHGIKQDWQADAPIVCVSWFDALAFCQWKSQKEGRLFLLPTEEQWEKAARGADGRIYPFGNHCDPSFCNLTNSFENGARLAGIEAIPSDESPYGARGMAGNSRDWCLNDPGERYREWRVLRGGAWHFTESDARCGMRFANAPDAISWHNGFRLCVPARVS